MKIVAGSGFLWFAVLALGALSLPRGPRLPASVRLAVLFCVPIALFLGLALLVIE